MRKKLRILAAGDLHGSTELAQRLSEKAEKERADVIILAGDIAGARNIDETVLKPFTKRKQKVLFVPGNWDDTWDRKTLEQQARNLHGRYAVYHDVGIVGIGNENWKMELDNKDFYILKYSFEKMKPEKRILVSHLHAARTKTELFGFEGDKIVRKAIDEFKPDIAIAAHIHEAAGIEEKVGSTHLFQVGRNGTIIEL